jgi:hypothetical protein
MLCDVSNAVTEFMVAARAVLLGFAPVARVEFQPACDPRDASRGSTALTVATMTFVTHR